MEKELKRVYIAKDDDGHNYVIPHELKDNFNRLVDESNEDYDAQNEFIEKYSKYMTGGDINLIELYARI